ncbi:hypothetical protein [Iodobacter ciconiae]|uniref:Uncharacterized protein n=1 Tax=Iodobacter ciconiae TaxID=2496266 RepID=A0A3S8ZNR5_9NEIS|nr:hypothetical protein [Iodobacter ciconiae]AZN35134.1 hypothetical protein EJO50_00710 [Iodobacter ciconiae]
MKVKYLLLAVTYSVFSLPILAYSKPFDADANAILKEDVPCFFILPTTKALPPKVSVSILVYDIGGPTTEVWGVYYKTPTITPSTTQTCIAYDKATLAEEQSIGKKLEFSRPYSADIATEDFVARINFCLMKTASNQPFLTKTNGQGSCTLEPLNAHKESTFWQRLFK